MVIVSIGNKEWDKNVRLAIDEWNDALGVDVFKETKNPSPLHSKITVTYENRASEDHFYAVGAYIVGNCLNSKITLFKNLNRYKQKTVILHELGHALGLEHSEDMSDIMYSSVSSSTNLSNNDIGRVDLEKVKCL
jgi:predicted Zn-dependent protease